MSIHRDGVLGLLPPKPALSRGTLARAKPPRPGVIGTDADGPAQSSERVGSAKASATNLDIDKMIEHLDKHAHSKSQGQCARYVRRSIESGGLTIPAPPQYAKDYGPTLTALGFKKVSPENYIPQRGDIVVLQPPKGQTAGHIQIFNGKTWVSDFVQGSGIYPGPAYRKDKVSYEIYRP